MRVILCSVFAYFFVLPVLAHAASEPGSYENCNPHYSYPATVEFYQPKINAQGGLDVSSASKDVSGFERTEDTESVTAESLMYGSNQKYKTKYVLHKKDGRPDRLEFVYDPKSPMLSGYPGTNTGPKVEKGVVRYGYVNGRCYVKESTTVYAGGKETIHYHHETCNDLLAASKGMSGKKLNECASAFSKMEMALQKHESEIETDKRELSIGFGGWALKENKDKKSSPWSHNMNTMMALSSCILTRTSYGMEVDPELKGVSGGAFIGWSPAPSNEKDGEKPGGTTTAE